MARILDLISNIQLLDYDPWAAKKAAEYAANLEAKGETIGIRDSMIAGITTRHSESLLT